MSNRFKSRYGDDINLFEGRWHRAQYALLTALLLVAPWLALVVAGILTAIVLVDRSQHRVIAEHGEKKRVHNQRR